MGGFRAFCTSLESLPGAEGLSPSLSTIQVAKFLVLGLTVPTAQKSQQLTRYSARMPEKLPCYEAGKGRGATPSVLC